MPFFFSFPEFSVKSSLMSGFFAQYDQLPQPQPTTDGGPSDAPAAVLEIAADSTPLLPGKVPCAYFLFHPALTLLPLLPFSLSFPCPLAP